MHDFIIVAGQVPTTLNALLRTGQAEPICSTFRLEQSAAELITCRRSACQTHPLQW